MSAMNTQQFYLETYGCQMNISDSNIIIHALKSDGWRQTDDMGQAQALIMNTCSVRHTAENRILGRLGKFNAEKSKRPHIHIVVTGCFAQREGVHFREKLPFIDYVVGTYHVQNIPALLRADAEQRSVFDSQELFTFAHAVPDTKHSFKSYVNCIMGCDNRCAYCIVPDVRGPQVSRSSADILKDVRRLIDTGVTEIIFLGQTITAYGHDNNDISFAQLLDTAARYNGIRRIRFVSAHPRYFTDELVDVIFSHDTICKHIHLPLQSGSSSVLQRMGRGYSFEEYMRIIKTIRAHGECALTTDILVGFPGETDAEYEETITHVQSIGFDDAFMYKYSGRPGVRAERMNNHIDEKVKSERLKNLVAIQLEIGENRAQRFNMTIGTAVLEGRSRNAQNEWLGRLDTNQLIIIAQPSSLSPFMVGQEVPVKITATRRVTFRGECIEERRSRYGSET